MRLLIREDDPAPGLPSGVRISSFYQPFEFNNAGHSLIGARVTGNGVTADNNVVLFSDIAGNGLEPLIREGQPAPDFAPGLIFRDFDRNNLALNNLDDIAFIAELTTPTVSSLGIGALYSDGAGRGLRLIAVEGAFAPGVRDHAILEDFPANGIALNDAGQTAFLALLSTEDSNTDSALYFSGATNPEPQLIVRTGEALHMQGTDESRIVMTLDFNPNNGFNDLGQLVFQATFDDGSQGIFTASPLDLLVGDYNTDGHVTQNDLDLVLLNWGDAVTPPGFNEDALAGGGPFDGLMSQNELDGVLLNWGLGFPPRVAAIPEPSTLASAMLLCMAGLHPRR